MRGFIALGLVGIALASASAASAHNTPWSWSSSRAAQMVVAGAVVQLPAAERGTLEAEIREARSEYLLAKMIAYEQGDWFAAGMFDNLVIRLTKARDKILSGLGVDKARCTGVGRASKGRFKHFRCSVSSQFVEIPTVARIDREGDRQIVVEGPPRVVALDAQFDVHVKGKASMVYRQVG